MKSKKGGNKKGKKGGKEKGGGGKKPPQQAPKGDEKPGFVLPESEKGVAPGCGCMATKSWADAYWKKHYPLLVEISRVNMHRYWDKVTDVQSKASLLHMLGYSLAIMAEGEAMKEGEKYNMEALELIRSMGERSAFDIVYGVWPEACLSGWFSKFLEQLDASERKHQMELMLEMINLTRRTINSQLEIVADNAEIVADNPAQVKLLHFFSERHYRTEVYAISDLSWCFSSLSEEETERWLAIFGKRMEEIKTALERKGWDLQDVKNVKQALLTCKCDLYEKQGKVELAVELARKALEEKNEDAISAITLNLLHAKLSLKTGRIEEALKSMEKNLLAFRSKGHKELAAQHFNHYFSLVPEESMPLFKALAPHYPHVLWAAIAGGYVELPEGKKKALWSQLESKQGLYCVNCNKELTKIYRCSRCDMATYCGSTCQKEAWKEHKKICKKKE
jgi:tetratricopeptide (TPR) repeat protein